jgi:hypothetical protein
LRNVSIGLPLDFQKIKKMHRINPANQENLDKIVVQTKEIKYQLPKGHKKVKYMGKQVNFFLHTNDMKDFYEILKSHNVVFLPIEFVDEKIITLEKFPDDYQESMFLVRKEDLDKVKLYEADSGKFKGKWRIDNTKSQGIEFEAGRYLPESLPDKELISRGRLYFQPDYLNENQKLVKYDETFIKWADALLNKVRRKLVKRKEIGGFISNFYLGKYADEWVNNANDVAAGGTAIYVPKK